MKRTYLTSREYDALLHRQNGVCCVPGCGESNRLVAEHSTPNAIRAFAETLIDLNESATRTKMQRLHGRGFEATVFLSEVEHKEV